jgi:hypothetical protein
MSPFRAALIVLLAGLLGGCYTVVRPTIAHVHIAHTTPGWSDTPGKAGLLSVAEREAETAAENARNGFRARLDATELKRYVSYALHAIDPSVQKVGPGTGYGLVRAMEGTADHVKFAAESEDASKNLKESMEALEVSASRIRQSAKVSLAIGQEILSTSKPEDLASLAEEFRNETDSAARQTRAWRVQLQEVIARENPPFTNIERRYLFGLIRLPNGLWKWAPDVDKASNQSQGSSGYR